MRPWERELTARGLIVGLSTAALLVLGVINVLYIFAQSPVVNTDLRVADDAGEWRMQGVGLLYERSAYFRERAVDFLVRAGEEGDVDEAIEMAGAAADAARQAVEAGPADPSSWLLLAWGEMLLGNDGRAREALMRSWQLAPQSLALASDRLLLTEALGLLASDDVEPAILASAERDFAILRDGDARSFDALRDMLPSVLARFETPEHST